MFPTPSHSTRLRGWHPAGLLVGLTSALIVMPSRAGADSRILTASEFPRLANRGINLADPGKYTVKVGGSRNDSSVVRTSVASMDSSDHRYTAITPMARPAARTDERARTTSHSVPSMQRAPSSVKSSIGNESWAPSDGR